MTTDLKPQQKGIAQPPRAHLPTSTARLKMVTAMIENTANALGADVSAGLKVIVVDVARRLTDDEIVAALERCRLEIRSVNGFPPRLTAADILEKGGIVYGGQAEDLEAVRAWDFLTYLSERHMRRDDGEVILTRHVTAGPDDCPKCEGRRITVSVKAGRNVAEECDCRTITPCPEVPDRLAKTVRRMGGWSMFYEIAPKNYPFVRRDFLAEYVRAGQLDNVVCLTDGPRHRGELASVSSSLSGIRNEIAAKSSVA
jgi:hypothetical protein